MARIKKSQLTKLEIVQVAARKFLEKGYTNTSAKAICEELEMSTGNLTFYYPTKEHLLAELIDMLCRFQWHMMEQEAAEGHSSVMAICLELMSMAAMCEEDEIAKDIYVSAYTSPMTLKLIRRNDARRAKEVFGAYCPDWTDQQFTEAETLVSGIEYATLMTTGDSIPLDVRIAGALNQILSIYGVPKELRMMKIKKVLSMDYRSTGRRVLGSFKRYVEQVTEQAFYDMLSVRV